MQAGHEMDTTISVDSSLIALSPSQLKSHHSSKHLTKIQSVNTYPNRSDMHPFAENGVSGPRLLAESNEAVDISITQTCPGMMDLECKVN